MGDTAETNDADAPRPSAPWPDRDSWIDLATVRESILGCVDPATGTVDKARLSKIEFQHNCRVAADVLHAVPKGKTIGIVKTAWSFPDDKTCVDGGTLYFVHSDAGRFSLRRDPSKSWTIKEVADAIALTLSATTVRACGQGDFHAYHRTMERLWEWSWMRVATIALADGPGTVSWTAERIDAMGAVLRALIDICTRRTDGRRPSLDNRLGSGKTIALAEIVLSKYDNGGVGGMYGADWSRVIDMERSLHGMLAWIDAMESTDVLFEHMLKHHQADRITRMVQGDPRIALPAGDTA
ncbi:hypothetical protein TW95_gp1188 [Pandoravirus inopinatum]|uniref:Uncharacterized protein n=1 Tax=Pandoravirus inopinatum TaxID=1605721 RepID=A0A0B5JDV2_9VIRU|nr:hypothetical protein TW95_gp1188 [Pandoravirus inopinatum]AJF97922.1 hypothetical protein [Pandoravirus inopinatum]